MSSDRDLDTLPREHPEPDDEHRSRHESGKDQRESSPPVVEEKSSDAGDHSGSANFPLILPSVCCVACIWDGGTTILRYSEALDESPIGDR